MTEAGLPLVPKSSEEWRLAVKDYLRTHPGTRLIDLKEFTDPERGPLFVWAQRMLGNKELFEEPRNRTLYIHGEQVAKKESADIVVRIIKEVPSFKDSNGVDRKLKTEDVVSLPDNTAKALIARGAAEEISVKPMPPDVPTAAPEASAGGGEPPSMPKAAAIPGDEPPNIPEQLRRPTFRFVLVKGGGKNPIEKGWQDGTNYPYEHDRLLNHLARGGNYGVLCGRGLVVIDADDPEVRETVLASLPQTFTVKTGRASGDGRHFYFLCEDLPDPIRLARLGDTKGTIGDVQSTGKQVIGPGSIHPSGNRYEVLESRPLATVTAEQIRFALRDFLPSVETDTLEDLKREMPHGSDELGQLRVEKVIPLDGLTRHGGKYQGPCPWHGSDTGSNFTIDTEKNVWHCFRHSSGGGPLQAIAVMEGVISCEESTKGRLRGEKFLRTLEHAEKKHGLLRQTRPSQVSKGPDAHPLWRYTVDPSNKLPLDQLWRWPECFALIGLKSSVPLETCEGELLAALERSGADVDQVKRALGTVQKLYEKYAPGEDKLDKKARDSIKGCGLKVGEDFTGGALEAKGGETSREQSRSGGAVDLTEAKDVLSSIVVYDFFSEEDGEGATILFNDGRIVVSTFDQMAGKGLNPQIIELLTTQYGELFGKGESWPLAGRLDLEEDISDLDEKLQSFIHRHVEYIDTRVEVLISHWIIVSYYPELLTHFPRLIFYGPTHSGKSRALLILSLLAYRGDNAVDSTGPATFRDIEERRVSSIIDEYQKLSKERRPDMDSIFIAGFDKNGCVKRVGEDGKVDRFWPWGPMAIGYKGGKIAEDQENRSILIYMAQKTRLDVERRVDVEGAKRLRTRLMAMRYRLLSSQEEFKAAFDKAWEAAESPILTEVGSIELDDRTIDMAANVIVGAIALGGGKDEFKSDLQLFAASQTKAKESLADSFPAQVFHALLEVLVREKSIPDLSKEVRVGNISTTAVADQLNQDLVEQGNDRSKKVQTARVGNALREMNFETKPGSRNKSYFVQDYGLDGEGPDTIFYPNLRRYLRKYGSGGAGDLEELEPKNREVSN
jgi:hypothetical protein